MRLEHCVEWGLALCIVDEMAPPIVSLDRARRPGHDDRISPELHDELAALIQVPRNHPDTAAIPRATMFGEHWTHLLALIGADRATQSPWRIGAFDVHSRISMMRARGADIGPSEPLLSLANFRLLNKDHRAMNWMPFLWLVMHMFNLAFHLETPLRGPGE
jgi:hypothetical protein